MSRIFWSDAEISILINVFAEKNILKLIDGRKLRKNEIYKIVETEFKKRGFHDKSAVSIEHKWKNLKQVFIKAKKGNTISGNSRQTCPFYEELNQLLGGRPSTTTISTGMDSLVECVIQEESDPELQPSQSVKENINEDSVCNKENEPPTSSKRKIANRPDLLKINKESIDYFFEKQKKTFKEQNAEFLKAETELIEKFGEETRKMLKDTNREFLQELRVIMRTEKDRPNMSSAKKASSAISSALEYSEDVTTELEEFIKFK